MRIKQMVELQVERPIALMCTDHWGTDTQHRSQAHSGRAQWRCQVAGAASASAAGGQ